MVGFLTAYTKGDSKSKTHFFVDEGIGVSPGKPLKFFTFELGKEKTVIKLRMALRVCPV